MPPAGPKAPNRRKRLDDVPDTRSPRIDRPDVTPGCPNPDCLNPEIYAEEDGSKWCIVCGSQITDDDLANVVEFAEDTGEGARPHGAAIGDNERFAGAAQQGKPQGVDQRSSSEISQMHGKREIRKQCNRLHLPEHICDAAFEVYKFCLMNNFLYGRRIGMVVSACLYLVCRKKKQLMMLIDFAEILKEGVYKLGAVYKDMKTQCYLDRYESDGGVPIIQVEDLVAKYTRKLEFGPDTTRVSEDAVKILRRMKRDWMVDGRNPAGLCGAAIILAARMNNYERTVREVVFTVKIGDVTVNKRLQEFNHTPTSQFTIDQFREFGLRLEKTAVGPPCLIMPVKKKKQKRKYVRKGKGDTSKNPHEIPDGASEASASRQGSQAPGPRRDSEGFVIPDVPVDPSLVSEFDRSASPQSISNSRQQTPTSTNGDANASQASSEAADDQNENDDVERPRKKARTNSRSAAPATAHSTRSPAEPSKSPSTSRNGIPASTSASPAPTGTSAPSKETGDGEDREYDEIQITGAKRKRGRPKKEPTRVVTEDELLSEAQLEREIEEELFKIKEWNSEINEWNKPFEERERSEKRKPLELTDEQNEYYEKHWRSARDKANEQREAIRRQNLEKDAGYEMKMGPGPVHEATPPPRSPNRPATPEEGETEPAVEAGAEEGAEEGAGQTNEGQEEEGEDATTHDVEAAYATPPYSQGHKRQSEDDDAADVEEFDDAEAGQNEDDGEEGDENEVEEDANEDEVNENEELDAETAENAENNEEAEADKEEEPLPNPHNDSDLTYLDSDPDIKDAFLTEVEVRIKEKIWVNNNIDWLRQQQTKQLLKEAEEELRQQDPENYPVKGRGRKRIRMGDGCSV